MGPPDSSIHRLLLLIPFRRGGGGVVMDHLPLAIDSDEQVCRLHSGGIFLLVSAEGNDHFDASDPGDLAQDGHPRVAAGHRPGPRIREDVLEGAPDLAPSLQTVPAWMNAGRRFLVR